LKRLDRTLLLIVIALSTLIPTAAEAQRAKVEVSIDVSDGSTRLLLRHSKRVVYAVREQVGRVELVYAEPVQVEPPEQRLDDQLLSHYEVQGDRTLVLFVGPGYHSHESFELRNPFRLVIDLQGVRPLEQADERGTRKKKKRSRQPRTIVVIDPGHGGVEHGAIGPTGLREKDVTLDLARRLRQLLEQDSSISVVLTRDEDRLVGLDERTAIANHNRADLFLSVHLNASPRTNARGAETYFLSTEATDDEARTLAALENRAYRVDKKSLSSNGDKDARNLELILWDLAQNQYLAESSALGESVQRHLDALTGVRNRGVRQAPFRVLMGATMPSVLVEVGFVSNREEELRLKNLGYRNQVVQAMAAAVREYLDNLQRLSEPTSGVRRGASRP